MVVMEQSQTRSVLLARQPIFDAAQNVQAYELLFRFSHDNPPPATSQWLTELLEHLRLCKVSDGRPLYIQVPQALFSQAKKPNVNTQSLVLELSAATLEERIVPLLSRWKGKGISIAVRDVHLLQSNWQDVLAAADLVKIDVMEESLDLEELVPALKAHSVRLVAERVETHGLFLMCKRLGFDYFQGFFFRKPGVMVESPALSSDKLKLLNLMGKALEAASPGELEEEIRHDLALSYKLLCFINSAYFGLREKVEGISHALAMLGLNNIRSWIAMLLMCNLARHKPHALLATAISRARFLELVAERNDEHAQAPNYFLLGMFSLLDAMLDMPMEMALEPVSLPPLVQQGLSWPESQPGRRLQLVVAMEAGDWERAEALATSLGLAGEWNRDYQQALHWTDQYMAMLVGDQDRQ